MWVQPGGDPDTPGKVYNFRRRNLGRLLSTESFHFHDTYGDDIDSVRCAVKE